MVRIHAGEPILEFRTSFAVWFLPRKKRSPGTNTPGEIIALHHRSGPRKLRVKLAAAQAGRSRQLFTYSRIIDWGHGFVTAVPDIRTMLCPKPPITSPTNDELSIVLMALFGASSIPDAVVGTIVVTLADGSVML